MCKAPGPYLGAEAARDEDREDNDPGADSPGEDDGSSVQDGGVRMAVTLNGFIRLHRKITDWEWYQNPNTFRVFLHCLLKANFTDGRFEGIEVKRGQFVTSLPSLSVQTSLSVRQVRVALDHLILTGELTSKSYPKFRIITVVKYNDYQNDDRQDDSQTTGKRQANDRQVTGK